MNTRLLRRGITRALAVSCAIALAGSAHAELWRMATKMPADSIEGRGFQAFADLVEEYSDGELEVRVFPSEQLGKVDASLEQLSAGTIHIYAEGPDFMNKWAPEIEWVFAPFLFEDREHWGRFMASDLVKGWLDRIEAEAGVTVIGDITAFPRGPYRVLSTTRDVSSVDDLDGMKLRMFENQVAIDAWEALGAEVRVLAWTDVYESIKTGLVESVTEPISLTESMKFYEVAPNIVRTDEFNQSIAFMVNAEAYNGLSDSNRAAVDRAFAEVSAAQAAEFDAVVKESIERMLSKGATYSEPDTSEWVARVQAVYQARAENGELPDGLLDAVEATR